MLARQACVSGISTADEAFLDELERAGVRFFWEQADPRTGLIKDRSLANGHRRIHSVSAAGDDPHAARDAGSTSGSRC